MIHSIPIRPGYSDGETMYHVFAFIKDITYQFQRIRKQVHEKESVTVEDTEKIQALSADVVRTCHEMKTYL